nr:glycosyltransferase [Mammaliicoccus sp. Marseille-Q6498]
MKILFVVNNFNFGGPQKSLLNLLYELEDKDVEVDLTILNNQDALVKYLPSYVNVIKIPSKFSLLMLSKENLFKNMFKNFLHPKLNLKVILFLFKSMLKLQKNVQAKQSFWINNKWKSEGNKKQYDYAIGVSGGHSIYYIVDYIEAKKKIGWIRTDYRVLKRDLNIDAKYFDKVDGMLAVSNLCADIFKNIFNISPKVFYNSLPIKLYENLNTEPFDLNPNTVNICTICRLDNGKGLDLLIDASKILKEKNVPVTWYVIGTGKLNNWLDQEIKDNKLESIVIPVGFVFNTGNILEKMDFLVHPSRFEGKSNTIDEALHYEKPVIATNFETVYEQIDDGVNGFIVEMDGKTISQKIAELVENPLLVNSLINNIKVNKPVTVDKGNEFLKTIIEIGKE